jgi:hypothetical protein
VRYPGSHAAMAVFFVFWQVGRNPTKKIKIRQSHAHTCVQGIIAKKIPRATFRYWLLI